jgi:hypothetical protein
MIPPSEWLSVIWGRTADEAAAVTITVKKNFSCSGTNHHSSQLMGLLALFGDLTAPMPQSLRAKPSVMSTEPWKLHCLPMGDARCSVIETEIEESHISKLHDTHMVDPSKRALIKAVPPMKATAL